MIRSNLRRGVSAGALTLILFSTASFAQQSLPVIEIGTIQRRATASRAPASRGVAVGPAAAEPNVSPSVAQAPKPEGYVVRSTNTGTKTNAPFLQTPMSVTVVPRAVIDDQKLTRVREALENVSGVQLAQSVGSGTGFLIRGFADSRKIFRNGLLATSPAGFRSEIDTANVERIEVLKGPAAMLYGRIEPGGLVNIVTKRPIDTPYYSVEQQFGSYDHYRTQWDATGPVFKDGSVLYRFSGGYQNSKSFQDFQFTDRVILNPSATFRPTQDTEFTADFEYFDQDYFATIGIPAVGDRPAPIPISRSFGDPNNTPFNVRTYRVGSELTHRFNEHLTFRNRFLASFLHTDDRQLKAVPPGNPNAALLANGVMRRNIIDQVSDAEVYTTNLDLLGNFDIGPTHHDTLVGFDYLRADSEYLISGNNRTADPALNINIYYPWPSYGVPIAYFLAAPYIRQVGFPRDRSVYKEDQKGAYFQDHITMFDKLHIWGGGRYDWSEVGRGFGPTLSEARANLTYAFPPVIRRDNAFSPRVGVLYQLLPWASVYGNWTNSFGANTGIDSNNRPHPPQLAEQFEVGVKTELFDRRLSTTLAFYNLTKTNVPTPDLKTPNPNDTIAIGKQRSRGVEFDAVGKVTDNVSLIGSFTYMDARITKDDTRDARGIPTILGHRLPNVPRYSGSMWIKWDVKEFTALDGLSLGFGAYVVGTRQGDNESTYQLPGYVRFDAMAAYQWGMWDSKLTAQLNIRNLTNTRYFESSDQLANSHPRLGIYPGAPLTAIGSIKVEF